VAKRGIKAPIDPNELERLAALHCTDEEIAAWFGISTRTVERNRKDPAFAEIIARGRAKGKISLRRTQMRLAEQGNPALAIWLGKQLLGQTDHISHEVSGSNTFVLMPVALPGQMFDPSGAAQTARDGAIDARAERIDVPFLE
jgi:hypothetical protein